MGDGELTYLEGVTAPKLVKVLEMLTGDGGSDVGEAGRARVIVEVKKKYSIDRFIIL